MLVFNIDKVVSNMAVYALDFDEIARARKALDQEADRLESNLKSTKGNLNSELSSWSGEASKKYDNNTEDNYETIAEDINTIRGMSSYLGEVSRVIDETEEALSSIKI